MTSHYNPKKHKHNKINFVIFYLWSRFVLELKRVADGLGLCTSRRFLDVLVVDVLVYVGARAGRAHLAHVEEEGLVGPLHRVVHCRGEEKLSVKNKSSQRYRPIISLT